MNSKINVHDVVSIAREAGGAIMRIYNQDFKVEYKEDKSPLTLADKSAHSIIEKRLGELSIKLPILSEEGKEVLYKERKLWKCFWLVDPLDGTKEFIKKNGEFTVNIALICKDEPVLGVVYAPALNICYWAEKGKGAFKDGVKLPIKANMDKRFYKIVVSRSHMSDATQAFIDSLVVNKKKKLVLSGSSLKVCLVAEGKADIYPRLGPTMEWDTGASCIVATEAKKRVVQFDTNAALLYNKERLLNPWFIVQ